MALVLTIVVFLTVVLVAFSFGAAAYAPSSLLGSRLRLWVGSAPSPKSSRHSKSASDRRSIPSARPFRFLRAKSPAPGNG